jgi:DNA-binding NarL/FixJ family response regulator
MVNIILVDDHKLIRDGISSYLKSEPDKYHLIGEAENGKEALTKIAALQPDLVITDLNMPEMDGLELIKELKKTYPAIKIIVLSMVDEAQYIKQVLKLGANGYLLKNSGAEDVKKSVDAVMDGQVYYSSEVTSVIMNQLVSGGKQKKVSRFDNEFTLTKREKEILKLIVQEYNNGEIADKLFISIRTVDAHKRNMIEKTGSKNIAGLLVWALKNNIVEDDDFS